MGVKKLKSITPGSRFATRSDFSELTTRSPEKDLLRHLGKAVEETTPVGLRFDAEEVGTKDATA